MPLLERSIRAGDRRVTHEWSMGVGSDRLWWGLTSPEALPQWLGELSQGVFTAGHVVTIAHAPGVSSTSLIREIELERLLGMTWDFPDEPTSYVRIRLAPLDGSSTRLSLTHDGLGDASVEYLSGWHAHILFLEALVLGRPRPMETFWSTHAGLIDPREDP